MFNWSNFDILQLLKAQPGRLKNFLLEVPIADLRNAIDELERTADLRYQNSRNQFQYRKNVLDMTLEEVIMACYNENILNFHERMMAINNTRIQNHPQYGHRLVRKCPEKYFIGERSGHFNKAKQIEQAYGILRSHFAAESNNDENPDQHPESNESDEEHDQASEEQDEDEEGGYEEQENLDQQPNQQNEDELDQNNKNSDDSFIVEDEQNSQYEFIEDSVDEDELIRNNRKKRKQNENSHNEMKVQNLERTTEKKLTKPVQIEKEEQINLKSYLLEPEELPNPANKLSKKDQNKLKKELKKLQTTSVDPLPTRITRATRSRNELEAAEKYECVRKTKMMLDIDDE